MQAVLEGNMYPYQYARTVDYKFFDNSLKVIKNEKGKKEVEFCALYGTYLNMPIFDCDKAEDKRKKIGFEPIKDYYRKRNSTYKCLKD
jgi:hypothetical protein